VTIDAKLALIHQLVREIGKQLETFMWPDSREPDATKVGSYPFSDGAYKIACDIKNWAGELEGDLRWLENERTEVASLTPAQRRTRIKEQRRTEEETIKRVRTPYLTDAEWRAELRAEAKSSRPDALWRHDNA
jgi:hypothetical protein